MAMTLLNDSSVALSLGQLNKNINKVGQSLAKLSTGQRITGASVDTASFAISEKMREQIRSLEQDIQNVQNGSSMLKTAHGGIENIVEELRSLKELAINAANDSNTDADRAIIQKEFDKRRETIDDIATNTNYNTKPLLDGTYFRPRSQILDIIKSYYVPGSVSTSTVTTVVEEDDDEESSTNGIGGTVDSQGVYTDGVTGFFNLGTMTASGKTAASVSWINGREVYGRFPNSAARRSYDGRNANEWLTLDFSSITARGNGGEESDSGLNDVLKDMHKQGFSILCSNWDWCPAFHGFVFDKSLSYGSGQKVVNTSGPVYSIGIGGMDEIFKNDSDEEEEIDLRDYLTEAFFYGVKSAISSSPGAPESVGYTQTPHYTTDEDGNSSLEYTDYIETIYLKGYGDEVDIRRVDRVYSDGTNADTTTYQLMQHYSMWIYEGYDMEALYEDPPPPIESPKTYTTTISYISITDPGYMKYVIEKERLEDFNPLTIHHGTHANQRTNFFINDMHTKSLKGSISEEDKQRLALLGDDREAYSAFANLLYEAKHKTLDQASVRTQRDANVAIKIVDGAIDYALDEATTIGAYLQRLDYTESNVVTSEENVQGAESTIRDADMAKEMTEYTKQNVLSQAAQSMLAQANQNLSSVLSLLQ